MDRNMISYFYADPHFGHAKIIEHAERPFADVDEMDRGAHQSLQREGWSGRCLPVGRGCFSDAVR